MSSTISDYDLSYSNVCIRINMTEKLLEEERQAYLSPNATIYEEANEQYNLLVELQYTDEQYNEVL